MRANGLADLVLTLTYVYELAPGQGWRHQSEQTMWSYKKPQPGPGCVADLTLVPGRDVCVPLSERSPTPADLLRAHI